MNSSGFQFRQFFVSHDRCGMKVGTDGILLGAWADPQRARQILDVGTGTGLIALMLAQRNPTATIAAVEIDSAAADQARENVLLSPWPDRVRVHAGSLEELSQELTNANDRFDLIVCNPPFFHDGTPAQNDQRQWARQANYLTANELFKQSTELLASTGSLAMIVPDDLFRSTISVSDQQDFQLHRHMSVRPLPGHNANRHLLEFSPGSGHETTCRELVIYSKPGLYTQDYWELTRPFYLKHTAAAPPSMTLNFD